MSEHGRRTHVGQCKGRSKREPLNLVSIESSESDRAEPHGDGDRGDEHADADGNDMDVPDVAPQAEAAPLPQSPRMPRQKGPHPFLSQADSEMAALCVSKFGLGAGTLDSILEIARRGEDISRTTKDLMSTVDELPGMSYHCAEIRIPDFPRGLYRLFYRKVTAAVSFVLEKHGRDLLKPELLPDPYTGMIEEMWQARRYQRLLRRFREGSEARDVLLPLIFFSGSYLSRFFALLCVRA